MISQNTRTAERIEEILLILQAIAHWALAQRNSNIIHDDLSVGRSLWTKLYRSLESQLNGRFGLRFLERNR